MTSIPSSNDFMAHTVVDGMDGCVGGGAGGGEVQTSNSGTMTATTRDRGSYVTRVSHLATTLWHAEL